MQDLCRLSVVLSGQEILELTPKECLALQKEGLYTCFIKNPSLQAKADAWKGRGRVFARPGTDDKRRGA